MDESSEGLASLIQQRLQRPVNPASDYDLTSRGQRAKLKILSQISQNQEPLVDSSGDEYFSASEEISDKKLQGRQKYAKNKGRGEYDLNTSGCLPHDDGPERAVNKASKNTKKKGKRDKSETDIVKAVNVDSHFLQYESLFETEITHWDQNSDNEDAEGISVVKQFPTLLELCLQSKVTQHVLQFLPSRMHGLVFKSKDAEEMTNAQIKWVGEVLASKEQNKDSFTSEERAPRTSKGRQKNFVHCPKTRNIFYRNAYEKSLLSMDQNERDDGEDGTQTLPVSHLFSPYLELYDPEKDLEKQERITFKVFTEAVDLLLPSFLPKKRVIADDCGGSYMYLDKLLSVAVGNTKHTMARRWPNLTKYCFNEALAYVWWARGDVTRACHAFNSIINSEKIAKKKATYINELGRLYRWFGLPERAGPQFQLTSVKSRSDPGFYDQEAMEIQSQVLTANSWDTGLLNGEKAAKSAGEWQFVLMGPELPSVLAQAAVESFLCFHGGQLTDKSSKVLEEAVSLLKRLVDKHPRLYEHLVLVLSLLGKPDDVKKMFEEFMNKFWMEQEELRYRTPGAEYSSDKVFVQPRPGNAGKIPSTFQPFLDQVMNDRGRVPELVKVIWRSQLCHPYFPVRSEFHDEPLKSVIPVVDFQQENLHLRLSSNGHITMDGQMFFPPVRAIHLDPYTGSFVHTHPSTCTEPWENMYTFYGTTAMNLCDFMPTPVCVFEDSNAKVEVNIASSKNKACLLGMATYTNYKGESVRVNLKDKIKEARYKECREIFQRISSRYDKYLVGTLPDDWKEVAQSILKDCCDRGLHFDCEVVMDYVRKQLNPPPSASGQTGKDKSKRKKKNSGSTSMSNLTDRKKFSLRLSDYRAVGDHLYLLFDCGIQPKHSWNAQDPRNPHVLVVLNTKTSETFSDVAVIVGSEKTKRDNFTKECWVVDSEEYSRHTTRENRSFLLPGNNRARRDKYASVFAGFRYDEGGMYSSRHVAVGNVDGLLTEENIHTIGRWVGDPRHDRYTLSHIIDQRLFGIDPDKDKLVHDISGNETSLEFKHIHYLDTVHRCVILHTDTGILFYEPVNLNPLNIVREHAVAGKFSLPSDPISLPGEFDLVKVLSSSELQVQSFPGTKTVRIGLAVDHQLVVVDLIEDEIDATPLSVSLLVTLPMSGVARDLCFISYSDGFIVTSSLYRPGEPWYREHLLQYSYEGKLLRVLPFLGPGPRDLFVVHLSGKPDCENDEKLQKEHPEVTKPGWFLYFNDGHGAVACIRASLD